MGNKIIGIVCIILGILFLFKNKVTRAEEEKSKQEVEAILLESDNDDSRLTKYYNRWLILATLKVMHEWFGFLFIIYGIDLLLRN